MQQQQTEDLDKPKKGDTESFWMGVFILFLLAAGAFFAVLFAFFKWRL